MRYRFSASFRVPGHGCALHRGQGLVDRLVGLHQPILPDAVAARTEHAVRRVLHRRAIRRHQLEIRRAAIFDEPEQIGFEIVGKVQRRAGVGRVAVENQLIERHRFIGHVEAAVGKGGVQHHVGIRHHIGEAAGDHQRIVSGKLILQQPADNIGSGFPVDGGPLGIVGVEVLSHVVQAQAGDAESPVGLVEGLRHAAQGGRGQDAVVILPRAGHHIVVISLGVLLIDLHGCHTEDIKPFRLGRCGQEIYGRIQTHVRPAGIIPQGGQSPFASDSAFHLQGGRQILPQPAVHPAAVFQLNIANPPSLQLLQDLYRLLCRGQALHPLVLDAEGGFQLIHRPQKLQVEREALPRLQRLQPSFSVRYCR